MPCPTVGGALSSAAIRPSVCPMSIAQRRCIIRACLFKGCMVTIEHQKPHAGRRTHWSLSQWLLGPEVAEATSKPTTLQKHSRWLHHRYAPVEQPSVRGISFRRSISCCKSDSYIAHKFIFLVWSLVSTAIFFTILYAYRSIHSIRMLEFLPRNSILAWYMCYCPVSVCLSVTSQLLSKWLNLSSRSRTSHGTLVF